MSELKPYGQVYCNVCEVPIGFKGQGPAYSAATLGWLCNDHVERWWRLKVDQAK